MPGLTAGQLLTALQDHALRLGCFDAVNGHEPKKAPGVGITAAVWVDRISPVRTSGLAGSSVLMTANVRLYTNMLGPTQDSIDPNLTDALDQLMAAYVGDFTLGGLIRKIDVHGEHGTTLDAQAGYIQQDGMLLRVYTLKVPMIVNDAWEQVP